MSELCLPNSTKSTHFSNLLLSDLKLLCSFIHSHPLYFSYFIFFSPYLFKLLSFLSPLFITTSLLLLGFLTVCPQPRAGFLLSAYHALIEKLSPKTGDESDNFRQFEELEVYKIVFDTSTFYEMENPDEVHELGSEENCFQDIEAPLIESSGYEISGMSLFDALDLDLEEKTVEVDWEETAIPVTEEKKLEGFLKRLDDFENIPCGEEKEIDPPGTNSDEEEVKKVVLSKRSGSEEIVDKIRKDTVKIDTDNGKECISKVASNSQNFDSHVNGADNGGDYTPRPFYSPSFRTLNSSFGNTDNGKEYISQVACNSQKLNSHVNGTDNGGDYTPGLFDSPSSRTLDSSLGSYGSMRREKEWKRTLACKLFEERHNGDGEEGMDLLWETYENDSSNKANTRGDKKNKNKNKNKNKKKISSENYYEDDCDDEDDMDGRLCCLQALKFSTGKMNLGMGMGRPNLVKISKAIKGFGWLHGVTRHSKRRGYTPNTL